jgi:hypothetical protein
MTHHYQKEKLEELHETDCFDFQQSVCIRGARCQLRHLYSNVPQERKTQMMHFIIGSLYDQYQSIIDIGFKLNHLLAKQGIDIEIYKLQEGF